MNTTRLLEKIKTLFIPLIESYLLKHLSAEDFTFKYIDARNECLALFTPDVPDDIHNIVHNVFFDADQFFCYYDPNDIDQVEFVQNNPALAILEPEFYKRCQGHYQKMIELLKKYQT